MANYDPFFSGHPVNRITTPNAFIQGQGNQWTFQPRDMLNSAYLLFYDPACPHCVNFAPQWGEFAEEAMKLDKLVYACNIGKENPLLRQWAFNQLGLKGVPTLYYICKTHKNMTLIQQRNRDYLTASLWMSK